MKTRFGLKKWIVGLCIAGLLAVGAGHAAAGEDTAASIPVELRGAGATFPAPLYSAWIKAYTSKQPGVRIEYEAVGSGEGVQKFLAREVDFAGSDAALTDEQMATVKNGVRLVPATAGMVVLAYHLRNLNGPLKLSREVYVDLLAGRISRWDDPRIQVLNPGLSLPKQNVTIVARQDSSGTTYALTNHLSAISADWRDRGPGAGKLVDWPGNAMAVRGNEGVASRIKISEGAIGYVEYGFAKRLGLAMAWLQNRAGQFVEPSERTGQAALSDSLAHMPANLRLFLPDPEGKEAYPIVTFSWLLLHGKYSDHARAAALKDFVDWGLGEGQELARALGYVPLPSEVARLSQAAVASVE
ncbi:MAG: phosphate ABC transporter substrate-binding protein PstS [Pseudomonadota bacterium]|jgi:phosphate transport system substrate-binding protein